MSRLPESSVVPLSRIESGWIEAPHFSDTGVAHAAAATSGQLSEGLMTLASRVERPGSHRELTWGRRSQSTLVVTALDTWEETTPRALAGWACGALRRAEKAGATTVSLLLPEPRGGDRSWNALFRTALCATYRFDEFRSGGGKKGRLRKIRFGVDSDAVQEARREHRLARAIATGVVTAMDLGNTPPNVAYPEELARRSRAVGRSVGARVTVLGPAQLEKRRMGGILAVGKGSARSPRLVRIALGDRGPKVAIVGKGVTFDTGGISIKPSAAMEEMKYDKCGACAVIGIVEAVGKIGLPIRLEAYLPFAENMPGREAYRPSDIVRISNGKTVEIINTDAEGRMILADAMSWAAQGKPKALLEMSTLTGANVVALGLTGAALYTPCETLAHGYLECAEAQLERVWRMPLWEEFHEAMEGTHADLRNSGTRWGGGNSAAAFLSNFVGSVESWAHLDIAGPAYRATPKGGDPAGATGFAVATTVQWLRRMAST